MARPALLPRLILIALLLGLNGSGALAATEDSVVRIEATAQGKTRSGSGFVVQVDGASGYVATAAHVVEGDPAPRVFFRSQPHRAIPASVVKLEGGDPNGFAVLLLDSGVPAGMQALAMAEGGGTDLDVREAVEAVGVPADIRNWAVIPGSVVTWKDRNMLVDARVDEGNSGGPLLARGAVVGMVMRAARFGEAVPAQYLSIFLRNNGVSWATAGGARPPVQPSDAAKPSPLARPETAPAVAKLQRPGPKPGETFRDCPTCPEMVVIPAGTFQMGSPTGEGGRANNEGPVHPVRIAKPLALATREVTVGEFGAFVKATDYRTEAEKGGGCFLLHGSSWDKDAKRNWRSPGFGQGDQHPVVCVSWNDAREYLSWLSKQAGQRYRLPSEAEWEYAARAGATTARFWGEHSNQACDFANVADEALKRQIPGAAGIHDCDDKFAYTAPVGSYKANAFGLLDILGNAWEWTEDCWNDSYKDAPSDGTALAKGDCEQRVLRGGSWSDDPDGVRSASRGRSNTEDRNSGFTGFRPARTL